MPGPVELADHAENMETDAPSKGQADAAGVFRSLAVWMFTFAQGGNANQKPRFPPPLQEPGTGARSCPRGPGFLMAPGHRASSVACWSPRVARATRSLPAARRGRDGLVRRLVDAKDLRQPGDLQDLQDPLLRADQVQRAVAGPHPLQAPDQHPEAGGVEEPDPAQVDDELVAALADQVDEQLPQPRRGVDIDLAPHVDDLNAVLGVVTQLQIHMSSG